MPIFNFQVTPSGTPKFEPIIAVNLLSPNIMVATSVFIAGIAPMTGAYRSFDGGNTWDNTILPLPAGFAGAEAQYIAYGYPTSFFIAAHAFTQDGLNGTTVVYRSFDNGLNWEPPVVVAPGYGVYINNDEPVIEVDNSQASPFRDNIYVGYNHQINITVNPRSVFFFQRSLDSAASWSQPVLLSDPADVIERPDIAISLTGVIYGGWININGPNTRFLVRTSLDGGASFTAASLISNVVLVPTVLPVPGYGFRVLTFPNLSVDRTTLSTSGRIYAVWQDFRQGYSNIFIAISVDQGISWSTPQPITGAPAGSQNFFPAIDVDPLTGVVNVIYYTNRLDGFLLDVFTARSIDGGITFFNQRVTSQSFNPNEGSPTPVTLIGDYIDIKSITPSGYIGIWTDTRTGSQTIFVGFNTDPVI
ncbi:sialidase family protein [Paenibacillus lutrae]|uniref:Exo-alpha-sialidase n=1 Tax=Paenibacillus lutrae TaxID=2078573 RepID=A0A7X3JXR7_9BACL|nr:sialidase family protein [Paenibacillus lutrae]MVO98267.1 exo-alpha-sialidase [Paenibacillus lutrae]